MLKAVVGYVRSHHLAIVALVIACSGTAYAASTIGGKDIKNESIRGADVRNDSLSGRDLRDGSIKTADLSASSVVLGAVIFDNSGAVQIENPIGVSDVQQTGVGTYSVTLPGGVAGCDFSATPQFGSGNVTVAITSAEGKVVEFTTFAADGTPADLGAGFGFDAFSMIAVCPG